MGILDLFKRDQSVAPETRSMPADLLPPSRNETTEVGVPQALSLSMVYRAINIHAIAAKQMSIHVERDGRRIDSPSWIKQPDINLPSRSAFIEQAVVSLATSGNAYWEITRDSSGRVMNLTHLNPLDVRIEANTAGQVLKYQINDRELRPAQVQHLSLLRVPGTNVGLGPIQAAKRELSGTIDTSTYANNWFKNSGVPSGILKSDQVLSPDQAVAAKNAWNSTAGGLNGVAVLGNGLNFAPLFLDPESAQWIQSQQFNITQIARLFGVPSSLMLADAGGSSMTYQNVEQDWIGYIRFSLMSYLVEIEDALSSLLPRGQEAKFQIEALLRSDTLTRYQAHQIAIAAGFMSVQEVRDIEGLEGNITPVNNGGTANV